VKLKDLKQAHARDRESAVNAFYLSLSDLMTLLCVFFAVLVGMSRIDVGSFEKLKTSVTGVSKGTLVELARDLEKIAAGQSGVSVRLAEDGVRLDFESAALFDTGSAILRQGSLDPMIPTLRRILATKYSIDVEGHTDDVPLYKREKGRGAEEVETNWTLSGRRASSVVNWLIDYGFSESRLRIVGYAATRPKIDVGQLDGAKLDRARSENRRVSILIR
jgi:chemotaxis protein MotB